MSGPWTLLAGGAAGVAVGLASFEGLWLTSTRIATARRPALLVLGSFAARSVLLLTVLVPSARAGWEILGLAVLGLLAGRALSLRRHLPPAPLRAGGGGRWS